MARAADRARQCPQARDPRRGHAACTRVRDEVLPNQGEYELTVVVGLARNGVTLLEVGYELDERGRIVIVHAMPARKKYL